MTWMADGNGAYDLADSRRLGAALEGLGFRWLEEPLPTDDYLAYAPLAGELSIPLAGGEILESAADTEPYLRAGSFDLVQPDVSICGGIGGVLEIAAAARDAGRFAVPHACSGAIALAATLHILAVLPVPPDAPKWAEPILEHDVGENPIRTDILTEPLTLDDGWMTIPDGPGPRGRRRRGGPPPPGGMTVDERCRCRGGARCQLRRADPLVRLATGRRDRRGRRRHDLLDRSRLPVDQLRGRHRPRPGDRGRADRGGRRLVRGARAAVALAGRADEPAASTSVSGSSAPATSSCSDSAGMALDLGGFEPEPPPAGVEIVTVDDLAGLDAWETIQRRALDLDETRTRAWRDAHDRALSADIPLRDWIALLDGVPVAAAALFVAAGVAGIYNVATVPEARGRGIGRAVTAAALAEAVARGERTAVLGSSELGYPVYRRLGFRDVSRLRSYGEPPPGAAAGRLRSVRYPAPAGSDRERHRRGVPGDADPAGPIEGDEAAAALDPLEDRQGPVGGGLRVQPAAHQVGRGLRQDDRDDPLAVPGRRTLRRWRCPRRARRR